MNVRRCVALLVVAMLVFASAPALAFGFVDGPVTTPMVVRSEGFEGLPYGPDLAIDPADVGPPDAAAYWGRITQRLHSGSYGLWVAGSIPASTNPDTWTYFGGTYPDFTYGIAAFDLPQLADYYSSSLEYWYLMPTAGAEDALQVMWDAKPAVGWEVKARGTVGSWTKEVWNLSSPSNTRNLSRTAGVARFGFVDIWELASSTGEGPTLDDVVITGYKFGPVRNLSATAPGGRAHLTWSVPWRSTLAAATEERPVAYRVWRTQNILPYVWTELTTTRQAGTTFDDPAALDGQYRYAVQAWDPGTGVGYGSETYATVTLSDPSAPPAAPSSLAAAQAAPAPAVALSWVDNASNEVSYVVERAASAAGPFEQIASLAAGSTSFTDSAVSWSSTWYYRVKAVNGTGSSAYAGPAAITLPSPPAPATVSTWVTIRTNATTARTGSVPILSGDVSHGGLIGKNMTVLVKRPAKTYWSYSSNRTIYSLYGAPKWQYKYYFKPGMVKGVYTYKATIPAYPGFEASVSPTTVSIRLR